jgi:hypothetical protein
MVLKPGIMVLKTSIVVLKPGIVVLKTSIMVLKPGIVVLKTSIVVLKTSIMVLNEKGPAILRGPRSGKGRPCGLLTGSKKGVL